MPGGLTNTQRRIDVAPVSGVDGPAPSFLEGVGAAFRTAEDEQDLLEQAPRNADAYQSLLDGLRDAGVDTRPSGALYRDASSNIPGVFRTFRVFDREAIIAEVNRQKALNPKLFSDFSAANAEDYDLAVSRRFGARDKDVAVTARAGLPATFVGGMGSAMTDPVNLMSLLVGGGYGSVAKAVVGEALIGMATEIGMIPDAKRAKERMGETMTVGDMAQRVALSGVASGVFGAAGHYAPQAGSVLKSQQEAAWAKIIPHLPEKLRPKMTGLDQLPTDVLADVTESVIGKANLSPDEKAAISVLRAKSRLDGVNPFYPGSPAHDGFGATLGRTIEDILAGPTPATRRVMASTAISSGRVAPQAARPAAQAVVGASAGARETLKRKIGRVESPSDTARPVDPKTGKLLSSAMGRYQFTNGTWLATHKAVFGNTGESEAQILAKKAKGDVQEILMDRLLDDNARTLARAGISETAGNLYLAHFAGAPGAVKLHRAAPGTPLVQVLGARAIHANRFIKGIQDFTAQDLIAWAHRKMGDVPPSIGAAAPDGIDPNAGVRAEIDALEREMRGGEPIAPEKLIDDTAMPVAEASQSLPDLPDALPDVPARPDADMAVDGFDVSAHMPAARGWVDDYGKSLRPATMARAFGVNEDQARLLLDELAKEGVIIRPAPKAKGKGDDVDISDRGYRQKPRGLTQQYDDVLTYIARRGGIRDDEGHGLGLKSVSGKERKGMVRAAIDAGERQRAKSRRDWSRFIPGAGPLLRHEGNSVDGIGEMLAEAGWFQGRLPDGERPTEADVLDLLDRAIAGENIYHPDEMADALAKMDQKANEERWFRTAAMRRNHDAIQTEAGKWELYLDPDEVDFALMELGRGGDANDVMMDIVRARAAQHLDGQGFEADTPDYQIEDFADDGTPIRDEWPTDYPAWESGGGPAPDGRITGGVRETEIRPYEDGPSEAGPLDPDGLKAFDDPDGPVAKSEADSLTHDARALAAASPDAAPDMFGGPTAADVRASLERQGQGRMKGDVPQKAPGSDGGLFDDNSAKQVDVEAMGFLLDENGDVRNYADLLSDLDADDDAIKQIKDCL